MIGKLIMEWKNFETDLPPKGEDILGYTDENTMKVVRWTGKAFNTYLKILFWRYLPEGPKPKKNEVSETPEKKKRGRPKKLPIQTE